jgi:hypothetical protein
MRGRCVSMWERERELMGKWGVLMYVYASTCNWQAVKGESEGPLLSSDYWACVQVDSPRALRRLVKGAQTYGQSQGAELDNGPTINGMSIQ